MKNTVKDFKSKSEKEIKNEILKLRDEIVKSRIDWAVTPPKDSNIISKKKKQIAQLQTILTEKNK